MNAPALPPAKVSTEYAWVLPVLALGGCVYLWEIFTSGVTDENKAAGQSIAAAVDAYKVKNSRYPAKLEELVPAFLTEVPQAAQYFGIYYAAEPDGTQCWLAYGVHRDRVEEYDCRNREWTNREIDDGLAWKHPAKQTIVPAMWRH
jgi:hypothetical protein